MKAGSLLFKEQLIMGACSLLFSWFSGQSYLLYPFFSFPDLSGTAYRVPVAQLDRESDF